MSKAEPNRCSIKSDTGGYDSTESTDKI